MYTENTSFFLFTAVTMILLDRDKKLISKSLCRMCCASLESNKVGKPCPIELKFYDLSNTLWNPYTVLVWILFCTMYSVFRLLFNLRILTSYGNEVVKIVEHFILWYIRTHIVNQFKT